MALRPACERSPGASAAWQTKSASTARSPLRWQFQQLCRFNPKHACKLANDLKARIARTFFKPAHVAAIHLGFISQIFLGQPPGMPQSAQIGSKDLAQIHAPGQSRCRLLTHRFKPTKITAEVDSTLVTARRRCSQASIRAPSPLSDCQCPDRRTRPRFSQPTERRYLIQSGRASERFSFGHASNSSFRTLIA